MAEKCDGNDSSICTICLGDFRKPRTLPCTHSFCELCVSEHIVSTATQPEQNTYNCPVCRYTVTIDDPKDDKSKWVSFLPLKAVSNIAQEIQQQNCHPCERSEKNTRASKWCCDCNEAFCQNCSHVHSNLNVTSKHKTVFIEDTELCRIQNFTFLQTTSDKCLVHIDRRVEVYCMDHNLALCIQCLIDKHRQCEKINLIEKPEDVNKENVNNLKSQITKLQTVIKTLIEGKTKNKDEISTTFSSIEAEALQIVTQIKTKLDDLYIELLKKAGIKQDEIQDELEKGLKELNKYSDVLDELMQNTELIHLYGSKIQIFLVSKDIESKITDTVQNLKNLFGKDEHIQVKSNLGDLLQRIGNLTNLGDLPETRTQTKSFFTKTMLDLGLENLLLVEFEFSTIGLKFISVLDNTDREVLSCVHLDNDVCALLMKSSLQLVNIFSNEVIDRIYVTGSDRSKKMCFDPINKILYCSRNGNTGFKCSSDGYKLKTYTSCTFDSMVCGVDVCDGTIYTVTNNAILKSENFESQSIWIEANTTGAEDDIAIERTSKRFSILRKNAQQVMFGSVKDKVLKPDVFCRTFEKAVGIAFGPSGVLFVAQNPSSIRVISNDEKSMKTLVTKLHKIKSIKDISVSHDNKKLYVCGDGGVEIYEIVSSKAV